jgi:hypothetical protein
MVRLIEKTRPRGLLLPISNMNETLSDCKALILAILHRAIADYLQPKQIPCNNPKTKQSRYKTAESFLFDDTTLIHYGDWILTPRELLLIADIDLSHVRDKIIKQHKYVDNQYRKRGESLL